MRLRKLTFGLALRMAFGMAAFGPLLSSCSGDFSNPVDPRLKSESHDYSSGRLLARPIGDQNKSDHPNDLGPGLHLLNLSAEVRQAKIYVPTSYRASKPAPLIVFFHGNRGTAQQGVDGFLKDSERTGTIFLFPESRKRTWDRVIDKEFGPDTDYIDQALQTTFNSLSIDRSHIAIAGFSDGASYSLALGQTNGDVFTHVIAFSPGGSNPASNPGRPPVFIIHGYRDDILPIDKCSRVIVPELKSEGYDVTYTEFDGMHLMTDEGKRLALDWFLHQD